MAACDDIVAGAWAKVQRAEERVILLTKEKFNVYPPPEAKLKGLLKFVGGLLEDETCASKENALQRVQRKLEKLLEK